MEAALVRVEGYKSMKADVAKEEATVTFDPKQTTPEKMAKAITEGTDFEASVPKGE